MRHKKVNENVAAAALYRLFGKEVTLMAFTAFSADLYPLVQATWNMDPAYAKCSCQAAK